jgi:hypothetical protein
MVEVVFVRKLLHASVYRDDVEPSNPYRLVAVQSIVCLRRLPIRDELLVKKLELFEQ